MKDNTAYKSEGNWIGRSLENYKSQHSSTAERKGVGAELKSAKTLTEARKIVYGHKRSNSKGR